MKPTGDITPRYVHLYIQSIGETQPQPDLTHAFSTLSLMEVNAAGSVMTVVWDYLVDSLLLFPGRHSDFQYSFA